MKIHQYAATGRSEIKELQQDELYLIQGERNTWHTKRFISLKKGVKCVGESDTILSS